MFIAVFAGWGGREGTKIREYMKLINPKEAKYTSPLCVIIDINVEQFICQSQTEKTYEEDLF